MDDFKYYVSFFFWIKNGGTGLFLARSLFIDHLVQSSTRFRNKLLFGDFYNTLQQA